MIALALLGTLIIPSEYPRTAFEKYKQIAEKIQKDDGYLTEELAKRPYFIRQLTKEPNNLAVALNNKTFVKQLLQSNPKSLASCYIALFSALESKNAIRIIGDCRKASNQTGLLLNESIQQILSGETSCTPAQIGEFLIWLCRENATDNRICASNQILACDAVMGQLISRFKADNDLGRRIFNAVSQKVDESRLSELYGERLSQFNTVTETKAEDIATDDHPVQSDLNMDMEEPTQPVAVLRTFS